MKPSVPTPRITQPSTSKNSGANEMEYVSNAIAVAVRAQIADLTNTLKLCVNVSAQLNPMVASR